MFICCLFHTIALQRNFATVRVHRLRAHSRPQCLLVKRICGQELWGRDWARGVVRVYDASFSFYNNSLDFLFAFIQSEYEVKKTVFVLLFQKQHFVHSFFGEISYYSIVYWMAKCVPALKWLLKFYFIWSSKKYLAQRSLFLFTTLRNIRSP